MRRCQIFRIDTMWVRFSLPSSLSCHSESGECLNWKHSRRDGPNWLAFHMQVSCRRVWSTTHSGVGGQTGSAQIWSTIHQQLRVPDLPPDVSFTDWASSPQQVTLVMMRPVVSTAQSMTVGDQIWVFSFAVCPAPVFVSSQSSVQSSRWCCQYIHLLGGLHLCSLPLNVPFW